MIFGILLVCDNFENVFTQTKLKILLMVFKLTLKVDNRDSV